MIALKMCTQFKSNIYGHLHIKQVNIVWPIVYTLGSIFLVVLPAIAAPKDTGKALIFQNVL